MLSKLEKLRRQTIMKNHNILKNKDCNCKSKNMGFGFWLGGKMGLGTLGSSFNTSHKHTIIIQNDKGVELHRFSANISELGKFGVMRLDTIGNFEKEIKDARNIEIIKSNGDVVNFEGLQATYVVCDKVRTQAKFAYSDFYKKQPDGKIVIGSTTQTMP